MIVILMGFSQKSWDITPTKNCDHTSIEMVELETLEILKKLDLGHHVPLLWINLPIALKSEKTGLSFHPESCSTPTKKLKKY
jgi:hypothetical protein